MFMEEPGACLWRHRRTMCEADSPPSRLECYVRGSSSRSHACQHVATRTCSFPTITCVSMHVEL